jgi:hypothetical protein
VLSPFTIDVVIIQSGVIATEFDGVMTAPLLRQSGSGPYSKMLNAVASGTLVFYERGGGYDPRVIVDLILKGVSANRPKTRYAAGRDAKAMMLMRKWLFDKVVLATIK